MITGYRPAQRQQDAQSQIGLLLQQAKIAAFRALQPQVISVADTRSPQQSLHIDIYIRQRLQSAVVAGLEPLFPTGLPDSLPCQPHHPLRSRHSDSSTQ